MAAESLQTTSSEVDGGCKQQPECICQHTIHDLVQVYTVRELTHINSCFVLAELVHRFLWSRLSPFINNKCLDQAGGKIYGQVIPVVLGK